MIIRITIFPGVKKEEVVETSSGFFDVKVREIPKQGRANRRMIELLSKHFQVSEKSIKIIQGFRKRNKEVLISL